MHYRRMLPSSERTFEIAYQNTTIEIPCCPECKADFEERSAALKRNAQTIIMAALGMAVAGALLLSLLVGDSRAFFGGLILLSIVATILSSPVLSMREAAIYRRYKELKKSGDHPSVRALLRMGARFGHHASS